MREIKFRAWDKENEVMADVDFFSKSVIGIKNAEFEDIENFILLQYTGLKDKNGKEIYEGDICETVSYSGSPAGTIDVVVYSKGSFKLTDLEELLLPIYFDDSDLKSVEVIGNIYENPELLKEEVK